MRFFRFIFKFIKHLTILIPTMALFCFGLYYVALYFISERPRVLDLGLSHLWESDVLLYLSLTTVLISLTGFFYYIYRSIKKTTVDDISFFTIYTALLIILFPILTFSSNVSHYTLYDFDEEKRGQEAIIKFTTNCLDNCDAFIQNKK